MNEKRLTSAQDCLAWANILVGPPTIRENLAGCVRTCWAAVTGTSVDQLHSPRQRIATTYSASSPLSSLLLPRVPACVMF